MHSSETLYNTVLAQFFTRILSIPLLANRLPLNSLTILSKSIPFNAISTASTQLVSELEGASIETRAHLLANLLAFAPPRYPSFTSTTLIAYLQLLAHIISGLPSNLFKQASTDGASKSAVTSWGTEDDDDEDSPIQVQKVTSFVEGPTKLPTLDPKTFARLNTVHSVKHMQSLVTAAKADARPAFAQFILALNEVWPAQRSQTLGAILAHAGGSLLRELYRGWVRGSALGRSDIMNSKSISSSIIVPRTGVKYA
jgi:ubiquitin-protein ligase E3 C